MDERRYSDEEARAIFERAAERQESSATSLVRPDEGYSLAELQEIAAEAGISPEHVASAAADLARRVDPPRELTWAGVPEFIAAHRVIESEITDREWEAVVRELRETFKRNGHVSQFGAIREWASSNHTEGESFVRLRLETNDGRT